MSLVTSTTGEVQSARPCVDCNSYTSYKILCSLFPTSTFSVKHNFLTTCQRNPCCLLKLVSSVVSFPLFCPNLPDFKVVHDIFMTVLRNHISASFRSDFFVMMKKMTMWQSQYSRAWPSGSAVAVVVVVMVVVKLAQLKATRQAVFVGIRL